MANVLSKNEQITTIFRHLKERVPHDVLISCPEWAEKRRYMPKKTTRKPGRFSFEDAPFAREIADNFSRNSPVREFAVMKGVQLGFTTSVIENGIGYTVDVDPAPAMFVFPSDQDCKDYKERKIDPLIAGSNLRHKIVAETENRNTRKTGDTAQKISFAGGFLKFVSARKSNALRSADIKYLFLDEVDDYPDTLKEQGSPIEIATKRTDSYANVCKICYGSTPVIAHKSKIYDLYMKGDQRKFYVPCPHCGKKQELVFYESNGGLYPDKRGIVKDGALYKPYGLMFDTAECRAGNFDSVRYRCKHCGKDFEDFYKKSIEQEGEWVPSERSKIPFFRSYHISALYSLTKPWWKIVSEFLDAGNDPKKLQVFYNLNLGLPFEDRTGGVEYQTVHRLKDDSMPNNIVPKEAFFLTAAADIQRDRIECEIKAWGNNYRCWGIDHRVFKGDTSDLYDPCWQELAKIGDEVFTDGRQIELMLVDSGDGENRDVVYSFCDLYGDGLFLPLKGFVSTTRTREKWKFSEIKEIDGLSLVNIYVDLYKNSLARYLSQAEPLGDNIPDGWFTFANGYTDEYFRQLTTERKVKVKTPGGLIVTKWEQHGRNEAFDLNVYNLAACDIIIYQYSVAYLGLEGANPRAVFEYMSLAQGTNNKTEA